MPVLFDFCLSSFPIHHTKNNSSATDVFFCSEYAFPTFQICHCKVLKSTRRFSNLICAMIAREARALLCNRASTSWHVKTALASYLITGRPIAIIYPRSNNLWLWFEWYSEDRCTVHVYFPEDNRDRFYRRKAKGLISWFFSRTLLINMCVCVTITE